jgi:hypothetical protein
VSQWTGTNRNWIYNTELGAGPDVPNLNCFENKGHALKYKIRCSVYISLSKGGLKNKLYLQNMQCCHCNTEINCAGSIQLILPVEKNSKMKDNMEIRTASNIDSLTVVEITVLNPPPMTIHRSYFVSLEVKMCSSHASLKWLPTS